MEDAGFAPRHTLRVLWRGRWLLVAGAILAAVVGYALSRGLPRTYVATGLLVVEGGPIAISELGAGTTATVSDARRTLTEAQVLRSRALAEAVVRDLDLAADPEFMKPPPWTPLTVARDALRWLLPPGEPGREADAAAVAADLLQAGLSIGASDRSSAITVSFRAETPELAARIVNRAMTLYIDGQVRSKSGMTARVNGILRARADSLAVEVLEADRKVQEFRAAHGLVERQGGDLTTLTLADLQAKLTAARGEVAALEASIAGAERALSTGGAANSGSEVAAEVLASPLIQMLRSQEAAVAGDLANQAQRLGPRHPQIRALRDQLDGLRGQIAGEIARIRGSLDRSLAVARARVDGLEARMAEARNRAETAATADVELQRLTKEADARRALHQAYLARVEQTAPGAAGSLPDVRIASSAVPPVRPSGPGGLTIAAFAGLAGLGVAGAGTVFRDLLGGKIHDVSEFVRVTGLPACGAVPSVGRERLCDVVVRAPQSAAAESVRGLLAALRKEGDGRLPRVTLVTSAEPGEGKTSLITALGRVASIDGARVLVIDADFRRPMVHAFLGGTPARSDSALLDDLLAAGEPPERALRFDRETGLGYLAAGGGLRNPQAVLSGPRLETLVRDAANAFDLVLIDTPPVLSVSDALLLMQHAEAVLFVGAWRRTGRASATQAARRLRLPEHAQAVAVLSRVAPGSARHSGYSGYRARDKAASAVPARLG